MRTDQTEESTWSLGSFAVTSCFAAVGNSRDDAARNVLHHSCASRHSWRCRRVDRSFVRRFRHTAPVVLRRQRGWWQWIGAVGHFHFPSLRLCVTVSDLQCGRGGRCCWSISEIWGGCWSHSRQYHWSHALHAMDPSYRMHSAYAMHAHARQGGRAIKRRVLG